MSHWAYTSGCADRAQLGCEIWIAKTITDAICRDISTQPSNVVVCETAPRYIYATLSLPCLKVGLLSAHAPTSSAPADVIKEFWRHLRSTLCKHSRPGVPILARVDANARLGSVCSASVGPLDADCEDSSGQLLREIAEEFNLMTPSTFSQNHTGLSPTCIGNARCEPKRIDYVMLPRLWCPAAHTSVASHIDIATTQVDCWCALLPEL